MLRSRDLEFCTQKMSASIEQSETSDTVSSRTRHHKSENPQEASKDFGKEKKESKGKKGKGKNAKAKEDQIEINEDISDKKKKRETNEEEEEGKEEGDKAGRSPKKQKTKENVEIYSYPEKEKIKKVTPPTRVLEQQAFIHPNYNADITKILTELGEIKKNLGDRFKYQQYMTAVESLTAYPKRVASGKK